MEEQGRDQVVPCEELHSLFVLISGAGGSHRIPYDRPALPPLLQSRFLTMQQNAASPAPCPTRLATKQEHEPSSSSVYTEPTSYECSFYDLPRPGKPDCKSFTEFDDTKNSFSMPASKPHSTSFDVQVQFPCDLESSFHSGLLNTTAHSSAAPRDGNTSAESFIKDPNVSDDCIGTVPDATVYTQRDEDSHEQTFFTPPSVKHHSSTKGDSGRTTNGLPLLFYPRKKPVQPSIKRRKLASFRH